MTNLKRTNLGFLLAKATQKWNDLLYSRFQEAGFPEVRASYGAILVPLFEEDGLRLGELAKRAHLSKQTMTTMIRLLEKENLVVQKPDPEDARAKRIYLTKKSQKFRSVAEAALLELEEIAFAVSGEPAAESTRLWLRRFCDL